jgi:hypothetical protein
MNVEVVLDKFIEILIDFKDKSFPKGSSQSTNFSYKYESLANLFHDSNEEYTNNMMASIKHHFRFIGRWLTDQCQVATQNRFREVGVNRNSDKMLYKLLSIK